MFRSCSSKAFPRLIALSMIVSSSVLAADDQPLNIDLTIGFEHDDNVSVDATDNQSGISDNGWTVGFSAEYVAQPESEAPIEISYDFSQSIYHELTDYNMQGHSLFVSSGKEISGFDISGMYGFSHTLLAGDKFLNLHTITPSIGFSLTDQIYLSAAYNYQNKKFFTSPDRDSNLNAGSIDSFIFFGEDGAFAKAGYKYEDEDTSSSEYDQNTNYLNLGVSLPVITATSKAEVTVDYQYYDRDFLSVTQSIGEERKDKRSSVTSQIALPVTEITTVLVSHQYIDSRSNLSSSAFNENIFKLALEVDY